MGFWCNALYHGNGEVPLRGENVEAVEEDILFGDLDLSPAIKADLTRSFGPRAIILVRSMLDRNPATRISLDKVEDMLRNPYPPEPEPIVANPIRRSAIQRGLHKIAKRWGEWRGTRGGRAQLA